MTACRLIAKAILPTAALCLPAGNARAEDAIDQMLRQGQIPATMTNQHGYSDFTDPLGRFLDLLAAGAFAEARAIQPAACADWRATRNTSAFTGKFWVWNTQIDLDTLCASK